MNEIQVFSANSKTETETEKTPLLEAQAPRTASASNDVSVPKIMFYILRNGVPMALSFTFAGSIILSAAFITRISAKNSENDSAAATLVSTLTNFYGTISSSLFLAIGVPVSSEYGKLRHLELEGGSESEAEKTAIRKNIANFFKSGILLGAIIVPFPMAGLFFARDILVHGFGQDPEVSALAQQYLRPYALAMPGLLARIITEQFLFSFEKTTPPMLMALTNFAIGTGLAYFLSVGPPKLGISGIAYGYIADSCLTSLAFMLYMAWQKSFKDIRFFDFFNLDKNIIKNAKEILKIGLPITAQFTFELSAILTLNLFAGWLGEDELAAQVFANQIMFIGFLPSIALAITVQQEVNRRLGQQDFRNAMRFARYGLLTAFGLVSSIIIPIAAVPKVLTTILTTPIGPNAQQMANKLTFIAAAQTCTDVLLTNMTQTLRSANDLYMPTALKIAFLWLGVLVAYYLGFHTDLGVYGILAGLLWGETLATMLVTPRWVNRTAEQAFSSQHAHAQIPAVPSNADPRETLCSRLVNYLPKVGQNFCSFFYKKDNQPSPNKDISSSFSVVGINSDADGNPADLIIKSAGLRAKI